MAHSLRSDSQREDPISLERNYNNTLTIQDVPKLPTLTSKQNNTTKRLTPLKTIMRIEDQMKNYSTFNTFRTRSRFQSLETDKDYQNESLGKYRLK